MARALTADCLALAQADHAPAVGLHTASMEGKGGSLLDREVLVGRAEDGKIVEIWQFFEDPGRTKEFFGR